MISCTCGGGSVKDHGHAWHCDTRKDNKPSSITTDPYAKHWAEFKHKLSKSVHPEHLGYLTEDFDKVVDSVMNSGYFRNQYVAGPDLFSSSLNHQNYTEIWIESNCRDAKKVYDLAIKKQPFAKVYWI